MSAQSTLAQSVQSLLAQNPNVALFSAMGNENESYWEGAYTRRSSLHRSPAAAMARPTTMDKRTGSAPRTKR